MHRNQLSTAEGTVIDAIPVTTPARTLIDLASLLPGRMVGPALDEALHRREITIPRLQRYLEAMHSGRPGVRSLRSLIAERIGRPAVTQNQLELRLLSLIRKCRLPDPVQQHEVWLHGRLAKVDFAYPEKLVAIEADSYRWHGAKSQWQRDLARRNALTALGWRVIHVTWADVNERPGEVVAAIRAALDL